MTQQIQQHLGPFQLMRQFLEQPKRLIGVDGPHPPPSPAPAPVTDPCASSRLQPPPPEFKKPPQQNSHHQSATRGGFVKPQDGKPPYGGRGGYPGQPLKHGGQNDQRSNSIIQAKGPPSRMNPHYVDNAESRSINRLQQAAKNLPRFDALDCPVDIQEPATPAPHEVESILKVSFLWFYISLRDSPVTVTHCRGHLAKNGKAND